MTIHIPRPIALALGAIFGAVFVAFVFEEAPDFVRYMKAEGM